MTVSRWTIAGIVLLICRSMSGAALAPTHTDEFAGHPRAVIISDIGNEPDDQMSLVRLLLYSNEIDIEALVAATSTWQKTVMHPETMRALIQAYEQVRPNLLLHAQGWPAAEDLDAPGLHRAARLRHGGHRKRATCPKARRRSFGPPTATTLVLCGSRIWGGANTLAQALIKVRATRPPAAVDRFIEKLRVYSISDQDDAGPWIRREFPDLFYIVEPSTQAARRILLRDLDRNQRRRLLSQRRGRGLPTVTNAWLETNIRSKGPLGKVYPRFVFIMEGDTPSFLGLIDNGLNA